jgi:isopenicillin N synthase-like dioxygenase
MERTMTRIVPVLDLSRLEQGASERRTFLADLRSAARDVGFFYLSGHGIPTSQIDVVLAAARRFFALPEADKLTIGMVNSSQFRGYTRAGGELTRGKADWREQLDIGVEREAIEQRPGLPAWTRLQGPNQWPASLPDLKPVLLNWQGRATAVAIRLLKAFALALEQPEDAFDAIYAEQPNHRMKIVRYPGRDLTGGEQGVGAHKDGGFLTLLLQDANKGLQVEYAGGWVDVDPIPGTLVVNIGELLELASNGYLRDRAPGDHPARRRGAHFGAVLLQRAARRHHPVAHAAGRTGRRGARAGERSRQPAFPRCRHQRPEEPAAVSSRRGASSLRRPRRPEFRLLARSVRAGEVKQAGPRSKPWRGN